jgi:hypothetical protein
MNLFLDSLYPMATQARGLGSDPDRESLGILAATKFEITATL